MKVGRWFDLRILSGGVNYQVIIGGDECPNGCAELMGKHYWGRNLGCTGGWSARGRDHAE